MRITKSTLVAALVALLTVAAERGVHCEPAPPIHLTVSGAVDAHAIATSLAAELGQPVAPVAECTTPCLSVTIADREATVAFTPAAGTPRTRTVSLGSDASAWPVVVTLLAGNLVRDEAADLLARMAVPAHPLPAGVILPSVGEPVIDPTAIAIAEPPPSHARLVREDDDDIESSTFQIGVIPLLSTDFTNLHRTHDLSLDVVLGVHGGTAGMELAGGVDIERGEVSGLQIGGLGVAGGAMSGMQMAGGFAIGGEVSGMQLAGGFVAGKDVSGMQMAGGASFARDLSGMQLSGGLNVARDVSGAQVAVINVASCVHGAQLGVVNVGGCSDGESYGLINLTRGSRLDLEATIDSHRIGTLLLRHGSHRWHNALGLAGQRVTVDDADGSTSHADLWMYGIGVGPTFHLAGSFVLDVDAMLWQLNRGSHVTDWDLISQLRVTLGLPLGPVTAVAGGTLSVNTMSDDNNRPELAERVVGPVSTGAGAQGSPTHEPRVWPGLFVGLRF